MFRKRQPSIALQTPRCTLRLPEMGNHLAWVEQRQNSAQFLKEWEPVWSPDHFSKRALSKTASIGRIKPSPITTDCRCLSSATKINACWVRSRWTISVAGPRNRETLGYWIGAEFARLGYMTEAINAVVAYSFSKT